MPACSLDRVHLLFTGTCEHFRAQDGPCKNSQHLDMSESPNITEVSATGIFTKQLQNFVWLPSSYWDSEDCVWQDRRCDVSSQKCAV